MGTIVEVLFAEECTYGFAEAKVAISERELTCSGDTP